VRSVLLVSVFFKETGSWDEFLWEVYSIKSVLSVHAQTVFINLYCLVKEKNKKKFLRASLWKHIQILKLGPKSSFSIFPDILLCHWSVFSSVQRWLSAKCSESQAAFGTILKVHKREKFFSSEFEFFTILYLVMLKF
jgi:hypothetical protein